MSRFFLTYLCWNKIIYWLCYGYAQTEDVDYPPKFWNIFFQPYFKFFSLIHTKNLKTSTRGFIILLDELLLRRGATLLKFLTKASEIIGLTFQWGECNACVNALHSQNNTGIPSRQVSGETSQGWGSSNRAGLSSGFTQAKTRSTFRICNPGADLPG